MQGFEWFTTRPRRDKRSQRRQMIPFVEGERLIYRRDEGEDPNGSTATLGVCLTDGSAHEITVEWRGVWSSHYPAVTPLFATLPQQVQYAIQAELNQQRADARALVNAMYADDVRQAKRFANYEMRNKELQLAGKLLRIRANLETRCDWYTPEDTLLLFSPIVVGEQLELLMPHATRKAAKRTLLGTLQSVTINNMAAAAVS